MKKILFFIFLVFASHVFAKEINFNKGWEFSTDSLQHVKIVDLPHDFSMEEVSVAVDPDHIGPFTSKSPNGRASGHVMGGTGWYRKYYTLADKDKENLVALLFDGAYMETDVMVNGQLMSSHKNGYTPFYVDITPALKPVGQKNEIIVKVRNYGKNSRWYSGSGLYRDVTLVVTNKRHINQWGAYITTPKVEKTNATVNLQVTVANDAIQDCNSVVVADILSPKGLKIASLESQVSLLAQTKQVVDLSTNVENPQLWSVENPALYVAKIYLKDSKGRVWDTYEQKFGIRSLSCNAKEGLKLNGEPIVLKGGCIHHDNGILGAAALKTAEYRKVRLLKENGYNAVRCAHNPPSRYFLDACDELGLLVMDEFTDMWEQPKNVDDYSQFFKDCWESDLESMLLRDRNHPSIIMWSIGNEIPNWSIADASRIGKALSDKVRQMDSTRLVTQGITGAYIHLEWDNSQYTFQHLDVAGYNYLRDKYDGDHEKFPERVMICTESYPNQSYQYWKDAVEKPYVIGDFVWTALEHLGESGCGSASYVDKNRKEQQGIIFQTSMGPKEGMNPAFMWMGGGGDASLASDKTDKKGKKDEKPEIPFWMRPPTMPATYVNWCGDVDLIGNIKSQGRYRNVMWDVSPIEILVHEPIPEGMKENMNLWGWPNEYASWYFPGQEGKSLQVRVITKAPKVRLEVNGKIVGVQEVDENLSAIFEDVTYQPGKIVAVSLDKDGKELDSKVIRTPGRPSAVRLTRERYNADNEVVYVKMEIVDEDGLVVPEKFPLSIRLDGAEFVSAGNGARDDMKSFRSQTPDTYRGSALLIIKPTASEVHVEVSSVGLVSGKCAFTADGKDILGKDFGVGLCSVIGINADFEDSMSRISKTGATFVELNNFMGGGMLGLTPEQTKAVADKYGLRILSDVTMASVIEDKKEYLDRWERIFREDAVLGVKYVSMTANLYWGDRKNVLKCCKVLNKLGAMAKKYDIQFLYHMHNIEFNPIVGSRNKDEQIIDVVMKHTDPELVKFQGDVFWIQMGGRDAATFLKEHGDRIPMLHIKDFYFVGEGDYMDYKSVFQTFYGLGHTDWVLEMEDPMTREQMYQKAKGHDEMSQAKEKPRLLFSQPGKRNVQQNHHIQSLPQVDENRLKAQNQSRLKALRDIEKNVQVLRDMPFIPVVSMER